MNSYQAKRIPLKDILAALGREPAKETRGEAWYLSPFRAEAEPSFKILIEKNIWYDFGLGAGGNVIDFAMQLYGVGTVGAALQALDRLIGNGMTPFSPAPQRTQALKAIVPKADGLEVRSIKPLENVALIEYLRSRAIPAEVARCYVQEIYYARQGKAYFSLAFPNRSGGYELRNAYFKGSHGVKDISIAPGDEHGGISVFEGFMDFLSALVYTRRAAPSIPALVLNSVAMRERAIEFLKEREVDTAYLYFDNDAAGRDLTEHFRMILAGKTIVDQANTYADFKDFNAFLVHRQSVIVSNNSIQA